MRLEYYNSMDTKPRILWICDNCKKTVHWEGPEVTKNPLLAHYMIWMHEDEEDKFAFDSFALDEEAEFMCSDECINEYQDLYGTY